jgi:hypothetical protein
MTAREELIAEREAIMSVEGESAASIAIVIAKYYSEDI